VKGLSRVIVYFKYFNYFSFAYDEQCLYNVGRPHAHVLVGSWID